jgi:hypothetical protein
MLTYASRLTFSDEERKIYVYTVQSKLTYYSVQVNVDEITLTGPGLVETLDRDEFPADLTTEAIALLAVLTFEDQQS